MPPPDEFDPYLAWLDIKPTEHPVDHYRLLGVDRYETDPERIQRAADSRMSAVRRFQTGPRGRFTQRLLNDLAAAKLCLLNTSRKATYDAVLRGQEAASRFATPLPPPVQEADDAADSHSPPIGKQRNVMTAVAEPTPPPVMDSSENEPVAKPIQSLKRPPIRTPGTPKLVVFAGLALLLGLAAGLVFVIVSLQGNGSSGKPESPSKDSLAKSGRDNPKAGDEPTPSPGPDEATLIKQEADGSFNFPASLAKLDGTSLKRVNEGSDGVINNWSNEDDLIRWEFFVTKPGFFKAQVQYAAEKAWAGGLYIIEIGNESKAGEVRVGDPPGSYLTDEMVVLVRKKGRCEIRLRAREIPAGELMRFRSLRLVPRD